MWMAHLVVDYQNIQPLQFNDSFSSNQLSNKISLCCNYRPKYTRQFSFTTILPQQFKKYYYKMLLISVLFTKSQRGNVIAEYSVKSASRNQEFCHILLGKRYSYRTHSHNCYVYSLSLKQLQLQCIQTVPDVSERRVLPA